MRLVYIHPRDTEEFKRDLSRIIFHFFFGVMNKLD